MIGKSSVIAMSCDAGPYGSISNIILGNDITIEIEFKLILFISKWVLDNLIEKYEMGSWPPPPPLTCVLLHASGIARYCVHSTTTLNV